MLSGKTECSGALHAGAMPYVINIDVPVLKNFTPVDACTLQQTPIDNCIHTMGIENAAMEIEDVSNEMEEVKECV